MEENNQKYSYIKTSEWQDVVKYVKQGYRWTMMAALGTQLVYGLEKEMTSDSPKVELD